MAGGRNGRFHIVGVHGYILGPKHYTQSNGGASRMTSPPSTLDIYISIHVISPPWGRPPTGVLGSSVGDDQRGADAGDDLLAS